MGRIGRFIQVANAGAADAELLARDRLAHELMYFSRGNPVIYYGDEQGFTGDGGDQLARQDMFPSRVAEYNDDDLIGTDATTAQSNFDAAHPLYRKVAQLAKLDADHPALRDGAQQHRSSTEGPGHLCVLAARPRGAARVRRRAQQRRDRARRRAIPTYVAGPALRPRLRLGPGAVRTSARGRLRVTVPPLSAVVYASSGRIPASEAAPTVFLASPSPAAGGPRADGGLTPLLDGKSFYEVTFQAQGRRRRVGRRSARTTTRPTASTTTFRARRRARRCSTGRSSSTTPATRGEPRAQHRGARAAHHPQSARGGRASPRPGPAAGPHRARALRQVRHLRAAHRDRRVDRDGDGQSSPDYTAVDDITGLGLRRGTPIRYRAILIEADGDEVPSRPRVVTVGPAPA